MVGYVWVKVSAAITVICGIYTSYKVSQYLRMKKMRILGANELGGCDAKRVMAEGTVVSSDGGLVVSSIEKLITYGSQGTKLRTNYIKHTSPFTLMSGESGVVINPDGILKIRCEPAESRHELLVYTLSQSIELFIQQLLAILTGSRFEGARSQKTKTCTIKSGSSVVVYGTLTKSSKPCIEAETIASSKEAILDYYFKNLTTPTVLFSICASITMILGFVYVNRPILAQNIEEVLPPELECSICFTRKKNVVFWPCKHVCICDVCLLSDITNCPLCRQRITHQYKIKY